MHIWWHVLIFWRKRQCRRATVQLLVRELQVAELTSCGSHWTAARLLVVSGLIAALGQAALSHVTDQGYAVHLALVLVDVAFEVLSCKGCA
jgi:hypothetical protein